MARQKRSSAVIRASDTPTIVARDKAGRGTRLPEPTILPDGTSLETTINNIVVGAVTTVNESIEDVSVTVNSLLERNVVQSAWIELPPGCEGETTLEGEFGEDAVHAPVLIAAAPGAGARFFDGVIPRYIAEIVDARTMRIAFNVSEPLPSPAKIVYIIGTAEKE